MKDGGKLVNKDVKEEKKLQETIILKGNIKTVYNKLISIPKELHLKKRLLCSCEILEAWTELIKENVLKRGPVLPDAF